MNDTISQDQTQSIPLSAGAVSQLKLDIDRLSKLRKEAMERLKVAREMGDLSENGAYKYAKFELGSLGRQIREKGQVLSRAVVVAKPNHPDRVMLGVSVTLLDLTTQKTVTYQIVNTHEADVLQGIISMESPLGVAIANKKVGEVVEIITPKSTRPMQITKIW